MLNSMQKARKTFIYRIFSGFIAFSFIFTAIPFSSYGQIAPLLAYNMPNHGQIMALSPIYTPVIVKGLMINPENPLEFDFIVDSGNDNLKGDALKEESLKLIKYFLATLTTPENELWVNLSPYEKNRIIADKLGTTEMGRDLLAQDYILKQLTASLMYPENELGKEFWAKIYEKAKKEFNTTDVPVDTFNKVWIVPSKAVVYEKDNSAFVLESHLKVMLEEDYIASQQTKDIDPPSAGKNPLVSGLRSSVSDLIRSVILPAIEKEVNEGKNFAPLRQIYHSMILATWFKKTLKESLLGKVYIDQNKTKGIDLADKNMKEKIYGQYIEAFNKGVYNYIKEEYDPKTQKIIPKKYFSGGFKGDLAVVVETVNPQNANPLLIAKAGKSAGKVFNEKVNLADVGPKANIDNAMITSAIANFVTQMEGMSFVKMANSEFVMDLVHSELAQELGVKDYLDRYFELTVILNEVLEKKFKGAVLNSKRMQITSLPDFLIRNYIKDGRLFISENELFRNDAVTEIKHEIEKFLNRPATLREGIKTLFPQIDLEKEWKSFSVKNKGVTQEEFLERFLAFSDIYYREAFGSDAEELLLDKTKTVTPFPRELFEKYINDPRLLVLPNSNEDEKWGYVQMRGEIETAIKELSAGPAKGDHIQAGLIEQLNGKIGSYIKELEDLSLQYFQTQDPNVKKSIETQINSMVDQINVFKPSTDDKLIMADENDIFSFNSFQQSPDFNLYYQKALKSILEGKYVPQFLFAGAATRLGVPMYNYDIWSLAQEKGLLQEGDAQFHYGMGPRQIMAFRMALEKIARNQNVDPQKIISQQRMIINTNGAIHDDMIKDFITNDFYGFNPKNIFFIKQPILKGYTIKDGKVVLAENSPAMPYGHGYNLMQLGASQQAQQVINKEVVNVTESVLNLFPQDVIITSHRVNDLTKFLVDEVIDIEKFALRLSLLDKGYNVVGELVENPNKQKGGNAVKSATTGKNFLLETLNFKGDPQLTAMVEAAAEKSAPYNAFRLTYEGLKNILSKTLPYNLRFKEGYFYLESVTGDIMQRPDVNAAFFKKEGTSIHDFKEEKNVEDAVKFLREQDKEIRSALGIVEKILPKVGPHTVGKGRLVQFGTSGDRGQFDVDFTREHKMRIFQGIANYHLKSGIKGAMLIGYDPRQDNRQAVEDAAAIFAANGIKVKIIIAEPTPVPVLAYFASSNKDIEGVTILTASHSPYTDGGIKYSPYHGGAAYTPVTQAIQEESNKVDSYKALSYERGKQEGLIEEISVSDAKKQYVDGYVVPTLKKIGAWNDIVKFIKNNSNFEVVLDAMQGAGGAYLEAIYTQLAQESGRKFFTMINEDNVDPTFSKVNNEPNPTKEKSRASLINMVNEKAVAGKKVMGASVDADSDRFGNVDSNGIFMSANDMIALIAYFLKKEIGLDGSIGKTVATSNFVNAIAEFLNVDLDEEKVGFKEFVNNTITKGKDYLVAGEESSHVAIGPFMRSWDDGIVVGLMGLWIMAKTGKSLTEYKDMIQKTLDKKFMITTLTRRSQIVKDIIINKVDQTNQEIANILKGEERALTEVELESLSLVQELEKMQPQKVKAINTKDGVKLVLASGDWVLIRPSGTEPAGKAYVEVAGNYAASETDMQKKFSELSSIVDQMIGYSGDNAMVSQQIDDEYDEGNVLSLYQEQSDYAMVGDLKDKAYQSANIFKQDYPQIYNLLTGRIEGLYWELLNPLKVKSVRQELQMFADGKLTEAITRNINRLQEIQEKENKKSLESPSDIWARASREKGLWQQADNLLLTVLRSKTSDLAMVAEIKEAYNAINPLKNKNIAVYNLMHDRIEFLELNYLNYQKRQGFIRELEMFSQGKLSEAIEINIQRLESLGDQEAKALWIQAKEAIEKNEKDNALITEIPVFSSIKDFYSPGEGKAIINQKNYYLNLFNLDFGTKIYRLNLFYGDFDDKGEIGTQIALYDSYDRPLARLKVFGENLLTLNWRDAFQKLADEGKIRFSDESNELTQKRYRELNEAVREMNLNNQQIIQAKIDLENPEFKPEDKDLIKTKIEILLRVAQGYIYSGNLESSYRILVESKELLSKISGLTSEEKKDLEFNLKKGTFYYNQAVDSSQDENLFKIQDSSVGGIDLNPEFLDMQIKRDGKGVPLPLNLQPLETLKIEGFIPVIINITPVENFPMLLGVNEKDTNEKKISFVQPELNPVEPLDRKILKA